MEVNEIFPQLNHLKGWSLGKLSLGKLVVGKVVVGEVVLGILVLGKLRWGNYQTPKIIIYINT